LRDSRVSPSQSLGAEKERRTSGGFGKTLSGWFASWDADMFFWRTSQDSFLWGAEEYSETWPKSVSMRNSCVYERQTWEPPTEGIGGFVSGRKGYPTPKSSDGERGGRGELLHFAKCGKPRGKMEDWPTPQAENFRQRSGERSGEMGLDRMAKWATLTSRDWKDGANTEVPVNGLLGRQVTRWSTPSAAMHNDGESVESWRTRQKRLKEKKINGNGAGEPLTIQVKASSLRNPDQTSGDTSQMRLNPLFVEWLMGLPKGWTAFEPLETESYLCKLRWHLESLVGGYDER